MNRTNALFASLIFLTGCGLNEDNKQSCQSQADCLEGFACGANMCQRIPSSCMVDEDCPSSQVCRADRCTAPTSDGGTRVNTPSNDSGVAFQYGGYETPTIKTGGLKINSDKVMVTFTSAQDALGCALTTDPNASPGGAEVTIVAQLDASGDRRCPAGVYPVISDPARCERSSTTDGLPTGCVVYKRWDENGMQIANRLAVGGYVEVRNSQLINDETSCNIIVEFRFGEDTPTFAALNYNFSNLGPEEQFCENKP